MAMSGNAAGLLAALALAETFDAFARDMGGLGVWFDPDPPETSSPSPLKP